MYCIVIFEASRIFLDLLFCLFCVWGCLRTDEEHLAPVAADSHDAAMMQSHEAAMMQSHEADMRQPNA